MFNFHTFLSAVVMMSLSVFGAWVAVRLPFFRKSQFRQGLLLGFLAVLSLFFVQKGTYLQNSIAFMDFPVLLAGLFFGPTACIASTGMVVVSKIAKDFFDVSHAIGWLDSCLASLVVCGYTIIVSRLSFSRMRPAVFTGFIAAAFGACMHLSCFFVTGMGDPAFTYRIVSDLFPTMVIGSGLTASLFALICPREDRSNRFFATNTLPFFVFGIAYSLIFISGMEAAKSKITEMLINGARDFNQTISDHIAFSMHRSASSICGRIGDGSAATSEELAKLAAAHSLDEVNIVKADGELFASSSKEIHKLKGTFRANPGSLRFRQSVKKGDRKTVVEKTFRASLKSPYEKTCFIEFPFPDRNMFLKPGYAESTFNSEFRKIFVPYMSGKPIGTNGYYLIVDKEGMIVGPVHSHPGFINENAASIGLRPKYASRPLYKTFKTYLFDEKVMSIRFREIGDLSLYACLPIHEIFNPILFNIVVTGIALLGLSFLFHWMMQRIAGMNREKEEHAKQELLFTRNIQMAEFKEKTPNTEHYKVSAVMLPSKIVGGDFYDFYELEGNRLLLGIGDVSGKGIPAAIFMMKMKTALKLCNFYCGNMKDAVDQSNREICNKNESRIFVTAFGSIFDPETGVLDFVNAGHNPPLVIRADGTVEWLKCLPNLPMGIKPDMKYQAQKFHLNHNDRLVLYTDGITESRNEKGELYGSQRLKAIIERARDKEDLIGAVVQDVKQFSGKMEQADDITLLTMLYR